MKTTQSLEWTLVRTYSKSDYQKFRQWQVYDSQGVYEYNETTGVSLTQPPFKQGMQGPPHR